MRTNPAAGRELRLPSLQELYEQWQREASRVAGDAENAFDDADDVYQAFRIQQGIAPQQYSEEEWVAFLQEQRGFEDPLKISKYLEGTADWAV